MITQALPRAVRRRPLSSLTVTTSIAAFGYANYVEWNASDFNDDGDSATTLPRSYYDPNAIANHWERRPISIAKRLLGVACELGPVAGEYLMEFQFRPWLLHRWSNVDDNGGATSGEDEREKQKKEKLELETNLSRKLRSSLTRLGPTFVKVGQQLSIRPDLVSPVVLYELQRLCDAVPPFEDEIAMRVLAEELVSRRAGHDAMATRTELSGEEVNDVILEVFREMPRLVASASLGQVYKATLRSTDTTTNNNNKNSSSSNDDENATTFEEHQVAIKIQRPDIFETVTLDLFLLVSYGKIVDRLCSIFTNQIPYHERFLDGFANGAFMEMNYVREAENQTYFGEELRSRFNGDHETTSSRALPFLRKFGKKTNNRRVEKVVVPRVHEEFTTRRVLVSEWIDGIPLARAPKEQIRELIPVGVELFLCQLLDIGRFHADPHPGNLYVTTSKVDGVTPTLCLLDFGLVAHVDQNARESMTRAIVNLLQGDYDTLISHDAKRLGFLPHDADVTALKPVLETILKEGLLESGSDLHDRRRNLMAISGELNEVFFKYPFSVPPFFALVTRGLGLLEGIALTGDPTFDIFQASYPYAKRRAIETFSVRDYGMISRNMLSLRRQPSRLD